MIRYTLLFSAMLAFMACISSSGLLSCGSEPSGCVVVCGEGVAESSCPPSGCSDDGDPFSESNGCGGKNQSGVPASGGCCVCGPCCCVFVVPDFRFELQPRPAEARSEDVFGNPDFCPQAVDFAIWHPPAATV
ncbi:MAG: hypothetical protein ACK4Q5_09245 [Saprospiraceae bacterium]